MPVTCPAKRAWANRDEPVSCPTTPPTREPVAVITPVTSTRLILLASADQPVTAPVY